MWLTFWAYERIVRGLGLLTLTTTMRKKTGFRGPHEWLSGTRVVRVIGYRRSAADAPVAGTRQFSRGGRRVDSSPGSA